MRWRTEWSGDPCRYVRSKARTSVKEKRRKHYDHHFPRPRMWRRQVTAGQVEVKDGEAAEVGEVSFENVCRGGS